jgi:hypothetical protein
MINTTHKTRAMLAGLVLLGTAASDSAFAQATGQTSVDINFPNIVILNYPSSLTLDFTATDPLEDAFDEGGISGLTAQPLGAATFDAGLTATGDNLVISNSVTVTVEDVWAVRGLSNDGDITVETQIDTAAATAGGGSSSATMSNLIVDDGNNSGGSIDVPSPGLAAGDAVVGDIVFDLDISGLTQAGTHSGMLYTITAAAP